MGRKPIFALVFALAGVMAVAILLYLETRRIDTPSADSVREVYVAQETFAQMHPAQGFASSLAELGPNGAQILDSVLASGKKSGYVFVLEAAPPDSSGRVVHYTLSVRPEKYEEGRSSFFMDESGIKRFTTEDRAASVNDPPVKRR